MVLTDCFAFAPGLRRRATRPLLFLMTGLALLAVVAPSTAVAQDVEEIRRLYTAGLEAYDFFEYDAAEQNFSEAVDLAKRTNIRDPIVAKVYLAKGILFHARFKDTAPDVARDKTFDEFVAAVSIDYEVEIPDDYRSEDLDKILADAREIVPPPSGGGGSTNTGGGSHSGGTVQLSHSKLTVADACRPITINATVPAHPDAFRVYLFYRPGDDPGYTSIELQPSTSNTELFTADIPLEATRSATIDYYIEVTNRQQAAVASIGGRSQPNTVTVIGECEIAGEKRPWVHVLIGVGAGVGLADGMSERCRTTPECYGEGNSSDRFEGVAAGMAPAPFHINGEVGINVTPDVQLAAYVRYQVVEQANAGMFGVKARYFLLNDPANRFYTGLGLGYGDATYVVDLGPEFFNFRDIVRAEGPVHIGFNLGYALAFHDHVGIQVDVYTPIHFPEKFSFHFDLSAGPFFQF